MLLGEELKAGAYQNLLTMVVVTPKLRLQTQLPNLGRGRYLAHKDLNQPQTDLLKVIIKLVTVSHKLSLVFLMLYHAFNSTISMHNI